MRTGVDSFRGTVTHFLRPRVVLHGVIRESRSARFMSAMYATVALIMAAVAVICALSHPVVIPGLVICAIAALALGLLSVGLRGSRTSTFRTGSSRLSGHLRKRFDAVDTMPAGYW